jgi:hypothetical protein
VPCRGYAKSPNVEPKDPEKFKLERDVSSTFRSVGARFGAYSMIVRRSGMEKILHYAKTYNIFLPYDLFYYLPEGMAMFTVRKDVVTTEVRAISDNGAPNYLDKKE